MNARSGKLMVQVLFLLLLTDLAFSEAINRTPARILAKQTGAAQFEEHVEQPTHDCNEHHHRLRKRSSDEDLDYEVYQGVVGRPGIDFPIYPRIPQTTFSCRSYGNGYFADLETGCQVFHICEQGRKISFLCPNGTIFQQSELTCDWWFKVNCAGSPGFYLESSEILNKARRQRVKPHRGYKNINKVAEIIPAGKTYKGSERRIDSNENPSVESLDFEDVSDDRSHDRSSEKLSASNGRSNGKSNVRTNEGSNGRSSDRSNNRLHGSNDRSNEKLKLDKQTFLTNPPVEDNHHRHNEQELQITAESGSFVKDPRRNSYTDDDKTLNKETEFNSDKPLEKNRDVTVPKVQGGARTNQRKDFNDKPKANRKIEEQEEEEKPASFYITTRPDVSNPSTTGKVSYYTTAQPEHYTNRNSLDGGLTPSDKQFVTPEIEDLNSRSSYSTLKPDFFANGPLLRTATTPSSYPGTYSTARRIGSTRTTPFYTPTVPSVVRTKPTESKTFIINVKSEEPTTLRGAVTTEYNTPRPIILGMRHSNSEVHRFPVFSNGDLKVQLPVYSVQSPKLAGLSLTTSTSGPTYLPKGMEENKNSPVTPANNENSVARNINGILQTVGMIKETMKANLEEKNNGPRPGLDIPPSSGPGTLVSLTNYFANGDQTTTTESSEEEKPTTASVDITAGLLSNKTSGKYFSLFGINQNDEADSETDNFSSATTAIPRIVENPTVIGDFTRTTIRDLAQNPETRKIAQVFSNAITKYIEDPERFRQGLIEVRPTEPTSKLVSGTVDYSTPSSFNKEGGVSVVVGDLQGDFDKDTTQSFLTTTTEKYESTTTESNDIAKEINDQFDSSTPFYDSASTESTEATTYRGSKFSTTRPKSYPDASLSSELLPPSHDEESEHETLHKVQSQSFVKSFNDLAKVEKTQNTIDKSAAKATTVGNPWLQDQKPARTEGPGVHSTISQDDDKSAYGTTTDRNNEKPTNGPWSQSINTDTQNKIDTPTVIVAAIARSKDQAILTQPRKGIYEPSNRIDSSTLKVGSLPEQDKNDFDTSTVKVKDGSVNQWPYQGRNKFDTVSITESTESKPTENPWTHTTQAPNSVTIDNSVEKVTTTSPWSANQKPTENPWSQITQSIYLDPLTINDGLMREPKTTTLSPFDYVNTDRSRFEDASQSEEGIDDILNSPELSSENLPKDSGLQRIANKIFGGLNETEAIHLQNVMKKAENNQSVLKLLLLLIQTCDDPNGKAMEKSRKTLLNALIGMDGKLRTNKGIAEVSSTTNKIPVTTYRGVYSSSTSTVRIPTTTLPANDETTKFEIRVPDPEEDDNTINTTTQNSVSSESQRQSKGYDNPNRTSDERALELLKSLYSLASKFSRR